MGDLVAEVRDATATLRRVATRIEGEFNDAIAADIFPELDRIHSWLKAKVALPTPSAPPEPSGEALYDPTA